MSDDKGTDKHADEPARTSKTAADTERSEQQKRPATPAQDGGKAAAAGATTSAQPSGDDTGTSTTNASAQESAGKSEQTRSAQDKSRGQNKHRNKNRHKGKNVSGQQAPAQRAPADRGTSGPATGDRSGRDTTGAGKNVNKEATGTHEPSTAVPSSARREQASGGATNGPAQGTTKGSSGGNGGQSGGRMATIVAVIALVIAIIALLGAAWVWQADMKRMVDVNNRMATLQNDVANNVRERIESDINSSVKPQLSQLKSKLGQVADANDQQSKSVKQLRQQLNTTRTQMADMSQRLQGSTRRWQLNEIEHLLITANRRLQLYQAPDQARQALKLASQSIARINDPRLFDVRKEIIDEMAALDALPSPDIDGMAMTLTAFIKRVPDLPLASDVPDNFKPDASAADDGIDFNSGWQHFVNSVGTALQSMATIRRTDGTQPALLPADQVYFLTQNLMLELRSARLALLQGNSTQYRTSLPTAIKWLKQYFDTDANSVSSIIEQLGQMQNIKLDWQAPDISASLVGLREYMQKRSKEKHDTAKKRDHKAAQEADQSNTGSDDDDNANAARQGKQ